jgi:hypothetical protein
MVQACWKKIALNLFWTAITIFGLVGLVALFNYAGAFGRIY